MKRPLWLAAGVALGVGGTLWAEQRVRRGVQRVTTALTPEHLVDGARTRVQGAGTRVRTAIDTGRREQARTADELWRDLETRPPAPRPVPGRPRTRRRLTP
jgi:hypothetical protein